MPETLTGGCHCGNIRYQVEVQSTEAYLCHCSMCRKSFGHFAAAFFNVPKDAVTWTTREPDYFESSKIARRGFCARCGTPMSFAFHATPRMDLSVGSLDEPERMRPTVHFAAESRLPAWRHIDALPEKRLDEIPKIGELWRQAYGEDVVPGPRLGRRE